MFSQFSLYRCSQYIGRFYGKRPTLDSCNNQIIFVFKVFSFRQIFFSSLIRHVDKMTVIQIDFELDVSWFVYWECQCQNSTIKNKTLLLKCIWHLHVWTSISTLPWRRQASIVEEFTCKVILTTIRNTGSASN